MRLLVDFESGCFKIRYFVNESTVLCTQSYVFEDGHIDTTAVNESTTRLILGERSSPVD